MSGQDDLREDPGQDLARWLGNLRNSNGAPTYQVIIDRIRANDPTSSLSMSTLTNAFNGRGFPRYETVVAIARALAGRQAAEEADKEYARARNRRDELERRKRHSAQGGPPVDTASTEPADGKKAQELPAVTVSDATAADLDLTVASARGGVRRRLTLWPIAALTAAAFAAITVVVLADPFSPGHATPASHAGGRASTKDSTADTVGDTSQTSPAAADPGSSSPGADPTAAANDVWTGRSPIAVQAQTVQDVCGSAYFDGTPQQYRAAQTIIPAPPRNAVVLGEAVQVTVQGRTQQSVILTGMRVDVTSSKPAPTHGIVVSYGQCGGGVEVRHFDLDLSRTPPTYTAKPADNFGKITPAVEFPYKISLDDPEVFELTPAKGCGKDKDCTYTVTLQWVADGKTGTTVLDNHGQGFRNLNPDHLPVYRQDPMSADGPTLRPQT
ncbi:hypothetical protein GCM10014715_89070 [Streptomyces spiralis]|uniref:Uncharacterized protein n=1 Tax=Streptomyces spiralis TaxID=66376 RepID=A0A919E798_9ACTN|nr:hypothetical protein [Streptomyces spiralis]GHF20993.1 hypothetical protein GCM10014715_89070 [Streptomyces spiralis]